MSPPLSRGQGPLDLTRAWWSFPTGAAREADMRPRLAKTSITSIDDWRMLKFLLLLDARYTDSGPHMYVRGSQRRRIFKHQATLLVGHPR